MKTLFISKSAGNGWSVLDVRKRFGASLGQKTGAAPFDTGREGRSFGTVVRAIRDNPVYSDRIALFGVVEEGVPRVIEAVLLDQNNKLVAGPYGGRPTEGGYISSTGLELDLLGHFNVGAVIPGGAKISKSAAASDDGHVNMSISESRNRRARKYATQNYSKENTEVLVLPNVKTRVETAKPRHSLDDHDRPSDEADDRPKGEVVPAMAPATEDAADDAGSQ